MRREGQENECLSCDDEMYVKLPAQCLAPRKTVKKGKCFPLSYPRPYIPAPTPIPSSHIFPFHFTTFIPPPLQRPPETAVSMVISILISLEFNGP